jgi:hypothetical protein
LRWFLVGAGAEQFATGAICGCDSMPGLPRSAAEWSAGILMFNGAWQEFSTHYEERNLATVTPANVAATSARGIDGTLTFDLCARFECADILGVNFSALRLISSATVPAVLCFCVLPWH